MGVQIKNLPIMPKSILLNIVFCLLTSISFSQHYTLHQNLPYDTISGVSPNLLSLDIYEPLNVTGLRPVMIYVHGGSWKGGNKTNVGSKADLFTSNGYVFVSLNYRLSPDPPDTSLVDAVRFPIHPRDVAKAIREVYDKIHAFQGDKNQLHLIGHSAGAHLINLVSTNENFLQAFGLSPANIGCACSLDAGVYNVQLEINLAEPNRAIMLISAFGTDPDLYPAASPLYNIQMGENIPNFLIVHQNTPHRNNISNGFVDQLQDLGHSGMAFNADPYSHNQINMTLGHPTDSIGMTEAVMTFFDGCSNAITSVMDQRDQNNFRISMFPNPTSGIIQIKSIAQGEVLIHNSWGQVVGKQPIINNQIDLSRLQNGAYFIQFFHKNKQVGIQKILKVE